MTFPVFGVSFKALEVGGGSAWRGGFTSQKGAVTSVGISQSCHLHPVPLIPSVTGFHLCRWRDPARHQQVWPTVLLGLQTLHRGLKILNIQFSSATRWAGWCLEFTLTDPVVTERWTASHRFGGEQQPAGDLVTGRESRHVNRASGSHLHVASVHAAMPS